MLCGISPGHRPAGRGGGPRDAPLCAQIKEEKRGRGESPRPRRFFAGLFAALEGLHPIAVVQNPLAQPQVLRGDLQQLVVRQELQALLQACLLYTSRCV